MTTEAGASIPLVSHPEQRQARTRQPKPAHGGWSFKIGEVRGIEIYVHGTFLILLAWIALSPILYGHGGAAALDGVLLTVTIFAIVVLHELGHALAAARYGIRTRDITLYPMGGIASLERIPDKPLQELVVALAGPAVNVALAALLYVLLSLGHVPIGAGQIEVVGGAFLVKILWVNVMLAVFNMLPAFPMDGGRVLRAALALRLGHDRATEIAAHVGQAMALGFGLVGMFTNPMLLFVALFVWTGAHAEALMVRVRSLMRGVYVGQAMTTSVRVLSPSDTLAQVVDAIVAGGYHAFPVMREGQLIGVVTKNSVLEALAEVGPQADVLAALDDKFEVADPSEMLEPALMRLQARGGHALVVMRSSRVLGIVTPQGVGELLTMRQAVEAHP